MKILITGGNGFIGKALRNFLSISHDVTVIDIELDDNYSGIQHLNDLSNNSNLLYQEIANCDLVIHLASPVGIFKIDKNAKTFLEEMLKINLTVFNLVKYYNKKIIYSSTSEVYKNTENELENDNLSIGCPDIIRWGYASGKLSSEFLCKSLCEKSIILRFFNATGVGDNKGVLFKFIESIKNKEDINVFGDGNQIRTFCDIRDVINFINRIINENVYKGEIYNVGNCKNIISIKELAEKCIQETKSNVNIKYKNYKDVFSDNYEDIQKRIPNCKKMNNIMTSQYSIEDIINSMYE